MKSVDFNLYNGDGDIASLKEVCFWWLLTYPEDIFVKEPVPIVEIRNNMKLLLKKMGELE